MLTVEEFKNRLQNIVTEQDAVITTQLLDNLVCGYTQDFETFSSVVDIPDEPENGEFEVILKPNESEAELQAEKEKYSELKKQYVERFFSGVDPEPQKDVPSADESIDELLRGEENA